MRRKPAVAKIPTTRARPQRMPLPAKVLKGYERYLQIAMDLPGAEQVTAYRTPGVKIAGKFMSRWRTEAEGALAIRCDFLDREILLQAQPEVFFVTDHYRDYPMILVRLDKIRKAALRDIAERAWHHVAPPKLKALRPDPHSRSQGMIGPKRRIATAAKST